MNEMFTLLAGTILVRGQKLSNLISDLDGRDVADEDREAMAAALEGIRDAFDKATTIILKSYK